MLDTINQRRVDFCTRVGYEKNQSTRKRNDNPGESQRCRKQRMLWCRLLKTHLLRLALVLALIPTVALAREAREQARIDFLIQSVEKADDATFIRNGSAYQGPAAAAHLRMKLNYVGERVKTAEQFIKYCASESSFTHRKYSVRTADGKATDAADYFAARLREFDQSHH